MGLAGAGVTASAFLDSAPDLTAQALRYGLAALILRGLAHARHGHLTVPTPREWPWVAGVAAIGMAGINVALVRGVRYADPAVFAVALGCLPMVLALVAPLAARRPPSLSMVAASLALACGTALVAGGGATTGTGLALAGVVLACEAAFTLLAIPVLHRLGAWSLSYYGSLLAAALLLAAGVLLEGPTAALRLSYPELLAVGFLAAGATAAAFVLWFGCVTVLSADGSAPLIGAMPAAAAATAWLSGISDPTWSTSVGVGIAVLAMGCGASRRSPRFATG
jgi:drug/metabolite transporter (DMT)-like permease